MPAHDRAIHVRPVSEMQHRLALSGDTYRKSLSVIQPEIHGFSRGLNGPFWSGSRCTA
jgi:hypothetical protein